MEESLIKKITDETLRRLKDGKKDAGGILFIFMGGDQDVDVSLAQARQISSSGKKCYFYMTKAAEHIIGKEKVLSCANFEFVPEQKIWDRDFLQSLAGIVVPVLTLNGLAKAAGMIADNAATNIILLGVRHSKKIVMASDSVVCCGGPEPPATSAYMKKINEMINTLRSFGIVMTRVDNLAREAADLFGIDTVRQPAGSVSGSGLPASPCNGNVEDCIECGLCVINREGDVRAIIDAGASRVSSKKVTGRVSNDVAPYIDHTLLKADATQEQIGELCDEAKKYEFATVCVNPSNVKLAKELLRGSPVGVTTVIGFPLGATTPTVKAIEARDAIANGADEIDMVINVGALKSGNYQLVEDDIKAVREATRGKVLKVILETAMLSREQIVKACALAKAAGADFVKTSTGFGPGGATAEAVRLMRETVGPAMGVKASGGIRTGDDAKNMIEAGASRIGASASVAIVTEGESK